MPRPRRPSAGAAGFTLLEVLVAFVIATAMLVATMQLFAQDLKAVGRAEAHSHAVLLAESRLESVGSETPLAPGATSGSDGRYRWSLYVEPFDSDGKSGTGLYRVVASVTWRNGAADSALTLETLRLASPQ